MFYFIILIKINGSRMTYQIFAPDRLVGKMTTNLRRNAKPHGLARIRLWVLGFGFRLGAEFINEKTA